MANVIDQELFTNGLFAVLEETFDTHHGIYLDKGTSLFETLESVTAAEASIPVGGKCASLAAQITHVIFYLEVLERSLLNQEIGKIDWGDIWRTVQEVTPDEWSHLNQQLKETYQRMFTMLRGRETWDEDSIGDSLAIVVHTAYHLGEIRQALCTLK